MWKVKYFQTRRGGFPVKEFIEDQNLNNRSRLEKSIYLLVKYGPFLKPPQIKKLARSLYELRIKGRIQIRVLYTVRNGEYILLHGFKKKYQKLPSKEIKTALDRIKELI